MKKISITNIAPIFAVIWLMYVMNTIIAWYSFSYVFIFIGAIGVIYCSFVIQRHVTTKGRKSMLILVLLYIVWEIINRGSIRVIITLFYTFVPFMCVLFWPVKELKETYNLFRKIVLFFAIGSSFIVILYYIGLLSMIPYYELQSKSYLHFNRGDIYQIYIIFPQLISNDFYRRACGFSLEGGHFSIVLGFVYLIDRYLQRKINPVIIICAFFAASPAFFLMMLFVEFVNIRRNIKKIMIAVLTIFIIVLGVYSFLPPNMQEAVSYLVYERNAEKYIESSEVGNLSDALDDRTNQLGLSTFKKMNTEEMILGGKGDQDIILSDYRGFIVSKGLISFVLAIFISLFSLSGAPFTLKVSLFLSLFMIVLHRAWFFYEPFPYLMSFIATSLYNYKQSFLLNNK